MNMNYGITKNFVDDLRKFTQYQFDIYNIEPSFPKDIANLKESDFKVEKCSYRKEFLEEKVLTIDAMDCKDMDDAVSLMKTSLGYRLTVHVENSRKPVFGFRLLEEKKFCKGLCLCFFLVGFICDEGVFAG